MQTINLIFDEEEEIIEVKAEDLIMRRYKLKDNTTKLSVDIRTRVPYNVSTYMKGKVGEVIAKALIDTANCGSCNIAELQKPGHVYDILDHESNLRIDVKFSPEKCEGKSHNHNWHFHFSSNKTRKDATQISAKKYMKDYQRDVDIILLIGAYNDRKKAAEIFMIPTDDMNFVGKSNIKIPVSCRGKFGKYKVDKDILSCKFKPAAAN